jgi:hypothetical protein
MIVDVIINVAAGMTGYFAVRLLGLYVLHRLDKRKGLVRR